MRVMCGDKVEQLSVCNKKLLVSVAFTGRGFKGSFVTNFDFFFTWLRYKLLSQDNKELSVPF